MRNENDTPIFFKKYAILHMLWVYIAWVAGYDLFRCLHDGKQFLDMELNPAVSVLYELLGSSLLALCLVKFVGSCICMTALLALRETKRAVMIYTAMAVIQTGVLLSYCPVLSPF